MTIEALMEEVEPKISGLGEDSRRLFHGRGMCYPGLQFATLDWYAPVLWLTLFEPPPEGWLEQLTEALVEAFPPALLRGIAAQLRFEKGAPTELLWGELPEDVVACEAGLRFKLSLGKHQNIGFFLDMVEGRSWLRARAEGMRVLNLFAYTCAFSVVAMDAGALQVINIDMSRSALRIGYHNHKLNGIDPRALQFWEHDIFRSWAKIKRHSPYDIIICDPPSYQRGSFIAKKDYKRLARRLPELLSEAGQLLACLNAPNLDYAFLQEVFAESCPELHLLAKLPPPPDFPDAHPDKGLKALHFSLDPPAAIR